MPCSPAHRADRRLAPPYHSRSPSSMTSSVDSWLRRGSSSPNSPIVRNPRFRNGFATLPSVLLFAFPSSMWEQDPGDDQREPGKLPQGQRLGGDHGAEQHPGDRVEQPDEPDRPRVEMPQTGEPRGERDRRGDDRDIGEPENGAVIERRRILEESGERQKHDRPGDE